MKNIITIIKKELRRVFLDRKLITSIVVLPGVMMFASFVLMGFLTNNDNDDDRVVDVHVVNYEYMPSEEEFERLMDRLDLVNIDISNLNFIEIELPENQNEIVEFMKDLQLLVTNEEKTLVLFFWTNFYDHISDVLDSSEYGQLSEVAVSGPQITIFRNSQNDDSNFAFNRINNLLTQISIEVTNRLLPDGRPVLDITDVPMMNERNLMASIFAAIFPMMIIISIVSAIVSITPEMIAGEKERGSLPILLVTSIKRSHLAIAKVVGATLITLVSVVSMLIGTVFGFQAMLGMTGDFAVENIYTITDYIQLLILFIVTTLSLTAMFSIISAFAKNTKEAMSYSTALMMIAMVIPIAATSIAIPDAYWLYLIPVINTTIMTTNIFVGISSTTGLMLTIASNLAFTIGLAFVLTRMFESEKVMFNK